MLYSIKSTYDLKNLNELTSLKSRVKALNLQNKLGKQNFHEDIKKVFEPNPLLKQRKMSLKMYQGP